MLFTQILKGNEFEFVETESSILHLTSAVLKVPEENFDDEISKRVYLIVLDPLRETETALCVLQYNKNENAVLNHYFDFEKAPYQFALSDNSAEVHLSGYWKDEKLSSEEEEEEIGRRILGSDLKEKINSILNSNQIQTETTSGLINNDEINDNYEMENKMSSDFNNRDISFDDGSFSSSEKREMKRNRSQTEEEHLVDQKSNKKIKHTNVKNNKKIELTSDENENDENVIIKNKKNKKNMTKCNCCSKKMMKPNGQCGCSPSCKCKGNCGCSGCSCE